MADDDELRRIRERAGEIASRTKDESTRELAEALANPTTPDPTSDPWLRLESSVLAGISEYAATLPPRKPGEISNELDAVSALRDRLCRRQRVLTQLHINAAIEAMPDEPLDYDRRLQIAREFNRLARLCNSVYSHPVTGRPALLLAVTSHNGLGRFTFEDVLTKKRLGSFKQCRDFHPVTLVKDPRSDGPAG